MDIVILAIGIIALLTGVLLLLAPETLIKAGEVLNRVLATESIIYSRRVLFGILLVAAGIYLVYVFSQFP